MGRNDCEQVLVTVHTEYPGYSNEVTVAHILVAIRDFLVRCRSHTFKVCVRTCVTQAHT